jgi:hypothetical protein
VLYDTVPVLPGESYYIIQGLLPADDVIGLNVSFNEHIIDF